MKNRTKRNWSEYNNKLKRSASINLYLSKDALNNWFFSEKRKAGGVKIYSDIAIEMGLILKSRFNLAYRQTEGLLKDIISIGKFNIKAPEYTTLSRRSGDLKIGLRVKKAISKLDQVNKEPIIIAIDSTGCSVQAASEWNRMKHGRQASQGGEKWKKLHIVINVHTGEILVSEYSDSNVNDCTMMCYLLKEVEEDVLAVCADMAYDTISCRKAILEKGARQLIPPKKNARAAKDNRNIPKDRKYILEERDAAIEYIRQNSINGNSSLARASWKKKSGYHARSLVETTMWQIKSHTSDRLKSKKADRRATEMKIKCKIINLINAA